MENANRLRAIADRLLAGPSGVAQRELAQELQEIATSLNPPRVKVVIEEGPVAPLEDSVPDPDPNPAPEPKEKAPAKRRSIKPVLPLRRKK